MLIVDGVPEVMHGNYHQDDITTSVTVVPILFALVIAVILSHLRIPTELVGMLVGIVFGYIIDTIYLFKEVVDGFWPTPTIILVLQPVLMLKMVYNIDTYMFMKCLSQILILSTLGFVIYDLFFGLLLIIFNNKEIRILNIVMAGAILAPIDVPDLIMELDQIKNLEVLMDGESVFGTAFCLMTFDLCITFYGSEQKGNAYVGVVFFYGQYIVYAIILGIILGKVSAFAFKYLYNDTINAITIIVGISYGTYFFADSVLKTSGTIALFIVLFCISQERSRLSAEADNDILNFLTATNTACELLATIAASAIVIVKVIGYFKNFDVAIAICVYVMGNVVRLVVLLVLSPILSRIGLGFDFTSMISIFWAAKKGVMQIVTTISLSYHSVTNSVGQQMLCFTIVYLILIFIVNGTTLKAILRKFGLIDFSAARKNNINNCFTLINEKRLRLIATMKMNRFFSDANWKMIQDVTKLTNIFEDESHRDDKKHLGRSHEAHCLNCDRVIIIEPTKNDLMEMTREVRMRMLKAKRVSLVRQYENGILSKDGARTLLQAVEVAMGSEELLIKLDDLFRTFTGAVLVKKVKAFLLKYKVEDIFKPPRNKFQKLCYRIASHMWFETTFYVLNVTNVIMGIAFRVWKQLAFLIPTNLFFLILYYMQFICKLTATSGQGTKLGLKIYFRTPWNRFDFCMLCINTIDQILLALKYLDDEYIPIIVLVMRSLNIFKLCKLFEKLNTKLVTYCDKLIDVKASYVFTIGKALVLAYEEVIELLPKISDNEKICDIIRNQIETDKMAVTKELGLLEKERPWIAVTVKTKQAITSTLTSMRNTIAQLKSEGFVDAYEYDRLHISLEDCFKNVAEIKSIETMPPKGIFFEVPWISDDDTVAEFLYDNATTKIWDGGDLICRQGQAAEGVFILVTGLFKLTYVPTEQYLEVLNVNGALPVKDLIKNIRFKEIQEDYILMGNSIGELSVMTGRPYSSTVVADTPSQAYIIPSGVIHEAISMSKDPVNGLGCRIWKYLSWNLVKRILIDTPSYESATHEQLFYVLDRAFVPNLDCFKILVLSELVEDVVLIEGLIVDYNTREIYSAPCYLPRTVQKIVLQHNVSKTKIVQVPPQQKLQTGIKTKLMIIPLKDADEYEIMERAEYVSEMLRRTPSCLLSEMRGPKRKKKGDALGKGRTSSSGGGSKTQQVFKHAQHSSSTGPSYASSQNSARDTSSFMTQSKTESVILTKEDEKMAKYTTHY